MKQNIIISTITVILSALSCNARSIHRPIDPLMPQIRVYWKDSSEKKYTLRNCYLQEYPYFKIFDKEYFNRYLLPEIIPPRKTNDKKSIDTAHIKKMIDELIVEVMADKKCYTNFDIVKDRDFNETEHCGVLVLKFQHYPLILKLFLENPKSITCPFNKGLEPCFFFFMGGGINRHLTGFTRLVNRELVEQKLEENPLWRGRVKLPRKWFFIPSSCQWISIEGTNIGTKDHQYIEIPGTYAIIADEIIAERVFSLYNKQDKEIALQLSYDLEMKIDANISNFRIEKSTYDIAIIDTEHFASLVGMQETKKFDSYVDFYSYLATKFLFNTMFQTKKDRRLAQKNINTYQLNYAVD